MRNTLYFQTANQYEYPGIKMVHELAVRDPECVVVYMHSKGATPQLGQRAHDATLPKGLAFSEVVHVVLLRKGELCCPAIESWLGGNGTSCDDCFCFDQAHDRCHTAGDAIAIAEKMPLDPSPGY